MKGVYAAFFRLDSERKIKIGALGKKVFKPGIYVYVGSAMNNVEKRVERHFSETENFHWHIDYFSAHAKPLRYFILPESSEYECLLAEILENLSESMKGLGASDCKCDAHLFRIEDTKLRYEERKN